jgi:hypothetical protein
MSSIMGERKAQAGLEQMIGEEAVGIEDRDPDGKVGKEVRISGFQPKRALTKNQRSRMVLQEAPIAQLDRASDYESAGRPFESGWARQCFQ